MAQKMLRVRQVFSDQNAIYVVTEDGQLLSGRLERAGTGYRWVWTPLLVTLEVSNG
jgi:hypothetical protein